MNCENFIQHVLNLPVGKHLFCSSLLLLEEVLKQHVKVRVAHSQGVPEVRATRAHTALHGRTVMQACWEGVLCALSGN